MPSATDSSASTPWSSACRPTSACCRARRPSIFLREHLFEFELDAYRPLGDPTRFLSALVTLFSRCKDEDITPATYERHAARLAAEARGPRRGGRRRGLGSRQRSAEEGGRQAELAARLRSLPGAARGERLHRLRRPGRPRAAPRARRRRPRGGRSRRASATSSSTSSRTRTERRPSSSRCSPSRTGT